ncbi:MAG: hypothetical protein KGZ43_11580, partial [Sulfuritalea sp.]|nr:hypothetical protein [Sulfuritalea sp.]
MRLPGIRARILLAALAPATGVAILVTGLLIAGQISQAEAEQHRRLAAVAGQLAALAEYSLFAGNLEALENLLQAAKREPDVVAAAFLDAQGRVLASTLPPDQLPPPERVLVGFDAPGPRSAIEHWRRLPIRANQLADTDFHAQTEQREPPPLGSLLLQASTRSLRDQTREYILKAAGISAATLLLAVFLAFAFSRGLMRTFTEIGRVVEGIGRGRHDMRVGAIGNDELGKLAAGINSMAAAVGQTQEQLAERIIEATATLRHERDEADLAARARSRFFAAASHDLRQPAQALGLFVARLQREEVAPDLQPKLRQLAQTVVNLQELLGALLDYSRLDGQVVRVEPRPVRAAQAIGQVVESFVSLAAEKRLRLRSRVQDCWLTTDPALLHRILINLVGNAVKHTRAGGILVACRRGVRQARIEVWDTGPGIPPEAQESIFDELVQLDNPERDAEKGLGLGLAIVRKSALLLGHPLSLCSRVGHGSRFALAVPLAEPAGAGAAAEDCRATPELQPILLVGPPRAETEELARRIESWGFAIERVAGIPAAGLATTLPRFVVLDVPDGAAGVERALVWLNRIAATSGQDLPALIVCSGPAP